MANAFSKEEIVALLLNAFGKRQQYTFMELLEIAKFPSVVIKFKFFHRMLAYIKFN